MSMMTHREKEVLDTLAKVDSAKLAALRLGIKTKTIYNEIYRIRKKYLKARRFVNQYESYRIHSPMLRDLLTPRVKLKI